MEKNTQWDFTTVGESCLPATAAQSARSTSATVVTSAGDSDERWQRWFGGWADEFAVAGSPTLEELEHLRHGRHPETGEDLSRRRPVCTCELSTLNFPSPVAAVWAVADGTTRAEIQASIWSAAGLALSTREELFKDAWAALDHPRPKGLATIARLNAVSVAGMPKLWVETTTSMFTSVRGSAHAISCSVLPDIATTADLGGENDWRVEFWSQLTTRLGLHTEFGQGGVDLLGLDEAVVDALSDRPRFQPCGEGEDDYGLVSWDALFDDQIDEPSPVGDLAGELFDHADECTAWIADQSEQCAWISRRELYQLTGDQWRKRLISAWLTRLAAVGEAPESLIDGIRTTTARLGLAVPNIAADPDLLADASTLAGGG
jgi:hypothetical protein